MSHSIKDRSDIKGSYYCIALNHLVIILCNKTSNLSLMSNVNTTKSISFFTALFNSIVQLNSINTKITYITQLSS